MSKSEKADLPKDEKKTETKDVPSEGTNLFDERKDETEEGKHKHLSHKDEDKKGETSKEHHHKSDSHKTEKELGQEHENESELEHDKKHEKKHGKEHEKERENERGHGKEHEKEHENERGHGKEYEKEHHKEYEKEHKKEHGTEHGKNHEKEHEKEHEKKHEKAHKKANEKEHDDEDEYDKDEDYMEEYEYAEEVYESDEYLDEYKHEELEHGEKIPHVEEGKTEMEPGEAEDWEKMAKATVRIEIDQTTERRRTIYELESYAASGPSSIDIKRLSDSGAVSSAPVEEDAIPQRKFRYTISLGIAGIARINLSPLTQKIVGCVIGENVTTEYPWVYVKKEIIEDNLDLHSESSDFLPIKDEVISYPASKMLLGYAPSVMEEGQFYICLTEEGKDAVVQIIQHQRREHEDRVRNSVFKPIRKWTDLGSGKEVDSGIIQKKRPLFEIEVQKKPIRKKKVFAKTFNRRLKTFVNLKTQINNK